MELRFVMELLGIEEDENGVGSWHWWRSGCLGFAGNGTIAYKGRLSCLGVGLEWCLVVGKVNNVAMVVYKTRD
ncbi:hypothetical protein Q3G72_006731 [Acer saccharum]|nr:hypothetical protein Q3G72_006731 [Acer saccharum]